jgi:hypothetical protein
MAPNAPGPSRPAAQAQRPQQQEEEEVDPMERLGTLERYMDQLTNHVQTLEKANKDQKDHIEQLEAQVMGTPASTNQNEGKPRMKMPKPMTFDGTRSKLKPFLVNMEMHLDEYKVIDDKQKIKFVASCFTSDAAEWIQPVLDDYYNTEESQWDEATKTIMRSYNNFKIKLTEAFGNIDEVRNAERQLRFLRQTGSAQQLAIQFRKITAPLSYDDDVLVGLFENMLKEEVQVELIKMDRPESIDKFIEMAVKIDNKLFEIKRKRQEFQFWKKTWWNTTNE